LGRVRHRIGALTVAVLAWAAIALLAVPTVPLRLVAAADSLGLRGHAADLPSAYELEHIAGRCQVTDGYGREAVLCPFEQPLENFATALPLAAVANEDKRFLTHPGVDSYRLPLAAWGTLTGRPSGASTLTQQTARILLLDPDDDSFGRKLREMILALRLERVWSKQEILTAYMNTVPLGRGVFGFERGARYFIGKPAAELTLADTLVLVAKVPAPERRDVDGRVSAADLEGWAAAAAVAAARMVEEGYVDAKEAAAATVEARRRILTERVFTGNRLLRATARRPFEYRRVRDLAKRQALKAGADFTRTARLFVNLDPAFQRQADAISRESPRGFETHAVFVDPAGAVMAISGGDYAKAPFNAAFDGSFSLASLGKVPVMIAASTAPGLLATPFSTDPIDGYSPREDSFHCKGDMLLEKAAALSCNRPFVRATALVGDDVARLSRDLGLLTPDNVLLTPVGGLYGNPLLVARMMGAVATGGRMTTPAAFAAAVDRFGQIVASPAPEEPLRVMSRDSAATVSAMLRLPVTDPHGTARAAAGRHQAAGVSGKTGTALEGKDAWFAGYTSDFTGVILSHAIGGSGMAGGGYPAQRFGALVDAYWVPRNATGAIAPVASPESLARLSERSWRHWGLDAARLSLALLAGVLLLMGSELRRTHRQGAREPSYPQPPVRPAEGETAPAE
jgi:penicillin-binding protein 1A